MIVFAAYDSLLAPLAGLTPTWAAIYNAETGAALGASPTIADMGDGLYRIESGIFRGSAGIIDLGATATPRYVHLDAETRYTVAAYDVSLTPLAGLAPSWVQFVSVESGLSIAPQPTFTELGGGLYRVNYGDTTPAAGIIDFGATAVPRYQAFTMPCPIAAGPPAILATDGEDGGIGFALRATRARG